MLTILPPRWRFITGATALQNRNVPVRLKWSIRCQSSSVSSSTSAAGFAMIVLPPTALTRMSMRPCSSTTRLTTPATWAASSASSALKRGMPYTKEGPRGPVWVTNRGASLGLACGMGSAGREYIPGRIHRSDRMAETGLYEDGKRGIRRITDPELRLQDQDRDGVPAQVLYRVLGTPGRL